MKRIVFFCMMLFAGLAVHATNNGEDSVSTIAVPMEQSSQDDDGWSCIGGVTLYHYCDCCNTCTGNLSGETRKANLWVKEVTSGKLIYKVSFGVKNVMGSIYTEYAVATFSHQSGYTIGRGTTDGGWDFYLYL